MLSLERQEKEGSLPSPPFAVWRIGGRGGDGYIIKKNRESQLHFGRLSTGFVSKDKFVKSR